MVFVSGDQMDGASRIQLGIPVFPGDIVDVSVILTAPEDNSQYTSYWKLQDEDGDSFGIGDQANDPL